MPPMDQEKSHIMMPKDSNLLAIVTLKIHGGPISTYLLNISPYLAKLIQTRTYISSK